jgi:hypothetical protein
MSRFQQQNKKGRNKPKLLTKILTTIAVPLVTRAVPIASIAA